jgi:hypothetical protein
MYFLDNLRAFVIMLVVVLHGSLTYMAYAPEWWYVVDPQNSLVFTILVLLIDVPIMLIMFFVAGYFALPSLARRGIGRFLQEKFMRVGAPWVVGVLLLAPPTAYLTYFSRNIPMSFLQFWRTDFWGVMYQQSVYWFLGVLMLFFAGLALVVSLWPVFKEASPQARHPSRLFLLTFVAIMTLGFLVMNQFYPLDFWHRATYLFVFQPLRAPLYLGYFGLGLVAYRQGWFTAGGYLPQLWPWLAVCMVFGVLYVAYRLVIPAPAQTTLALQAGNAFLVNTFCFSSLLAGAAYFQRYVNHTSPFWSSQAASSYGIYYIHPLILYPLAYLFLPVSLPALLKGPLVILLGFGLSWVVSALLLKRSPVFRRVF